jgi:hypothetical protein
MWLYNGECVTEFDKQYIGFVYIITNLLTNKQYIGKKLFLFKKVVVKNKKKKRVLVESDWEKYYGSSLHLSEDVVKYGNENFRREILKFCKTKSECSYYEAKYQFEYDVLLKPEDFYNDWISCRVRRAHLRKIIDNEEIVCKNIKIQK